MSLHYTTLHYTPTPTLHDTTRRYTTLQLQLQPRLTATAATATTPLLSTLHSPLHHTTTTPNYNYNYNCTWHYTTPHYIQQLWLRRPLQPLPKNTTRTNFRSIFDTSATALCGTTGSYKYYVISVFQPHITPRERETDTYIYIHLSLFIKYIYILYCQKWTCT